MAYVIAEPCIGTKDNSCVEVCPVDCIAGVRLRTRKGRALNLGIRGDGGSLHGLVRSPALQIAVDWVSLCLRVGNN
jgi:NAD-dependent dihydropyrimidine dehydrogenase PreA subunit